MRKATDGSITVELIGNDVKVINAEDKRSKFLELQEVQDNSNRLIHVLDPVVDYVVFMFSSYWRPSDIKSLARCLQQLNVVPSAK